MSTTSAVRLTRPGGLTRNVHQSHSGPLLVGLWGKLHFWLERKRQSDALRARADDERLLADIGLTREQVLYEANKPFWQ